MKTTKKYHIMQMVFLLVFSVLFLNNCGSTDIVSGAKNTCKDGVWASDEDLLLAPADASAATYGPNFGGGVAPFAPLTFYVTDKLGHAKNNICVDFYSDGTFYTDDTLTVPVVSTSYFSHFAGLTDQNGAVRVYWVSEVLPPSNPVVGTTAGQDIVDDSFVDAYSGIHTASFRFPWTVKGNQP